MDKREAIKIVRAYKLLLNDYFQLENVYLFGSYAKNSNREDSDIDVAIVVNHIEGDYFSVNPLLWKLRRQIDDRIEPILIEKDFDDANFLADIKKFGIEIA
jgi:predicted nucleotidyltransferase